MCKVPKFKLGLFLKKIFPPPPPLGNFPHIFLRGGVTKKKRENLGKIPKGGGVKKNRRKFPISIWEFEKPRGVSIFQKCLNFNYFAIILQLFCNITFIRNVWKSKMSEFDPRGGGVSNFQKCLKFNKVWNFRWWGGVKPIWEFFPNFSVFFMMASLN